MTTAVLDKLTPDAHLPTVPFRMSGYDGPTTSAEMTEECRQLAGARAAIQGPFQRRPEDVRTLLWRARALDIPVGVAIDHIYINMQGKAGLSAQLIAALIRRAGIDWVTVKTPNLVRFTFFRVRWTISPAGRITKRKDWIGQPVQFELIEAQAAGIAGTKHWQAWPIACMWARAMARAGRELFSDITMGFSYTPEELHDGTAAEAAPAAAEQVSDAVTELIEQALSEPATAHLIKTDIMVRGAKLLKEHAGDGQTLAQVLADIWQQKVAFEEDQQIAVAADQAMAAAGITAPPAAADPGADDWKDSPLGEGPLPCGCSSAVLLTDVHEEGCTGVLPE